MKILVNSNNEILSYSLVGNIASGIDVTMDQIPTEFFMNFQAKRYKFENEVVVFNEDYEIDDSDNVIPHSIDQEIRVAFGSLQMSSVQTAKIVSELTEQVSELTKQNVELQKQIDNKGDE